MDESEGNRRNRKPNYTRDEVLTIICGVQENKFNLLKKSCTVSSNKVKQAGWKAICDRLNFFNPDRQRTVEEVRKKWKDLSAQARNDLMVRRTSGGAELGHNGQSTVGAGKFEKEAPQGEFTPLILAILGEVGSIDVSSEESELININLGTLGALSETQTEADTAVYDTVMIQKQDTSDTQSDQDVKHLDDSDSKKRMRKPNYTKKDVLNLIQGVSDNKFQLLAKTNNHSSNKVKTDCWAAICNTVNAFNPDVERTTEELRKKWKDLATQARADLANLRNAVAAGNNKAITPIGEFTSLCLPILAEVGVCDVTAEEINALKVSTVTTVINLHQSGVAEFVTTSQPNMLPSVIEKDCDSFVSDSGAFNTSSLIGAPTAVGAVNEEPSAPAEYALSTLASVSASKLKEKIREKLASGTGSSPQSDLTDFQAAQAELQAVGVEVRLIENHHQDQQHHHQQPQIIDNSGDHHHQHITLEDPGMATNAATIITDRGQQQHQQQQQQQDQQQAATVTLHGGNPATLQISSPTPHQLFRTNFLTGSTAPVGESNPLKRKTPSDQSHASAVANGNNAHNILAAGGTIISSSVGQPHIMPIPPIPVSLHPSGLSAPVTILTGTPLIPSAAPSGNNHHQTSNSPTQGLFTPWAAEKQALEREKLVAEVDVLRLQKFKLRLEIEALLQNRQADSCQLLEECLK